MSGAKLFSEMLLEMARPSRYTTKEDISRAIDAFDDLPKAKQQAEAKSILKSAEKIGYNVRAEKILKYKNDKKDDVKSNVTYFEGSVDIRKYTRSVTAPVLPIKLKVENNFIIGEAAMNSLPEELEVGGSLNLQYSKNYKPMKTLKVDGNLSASWTQLEKIADNITVGGDLKANSSQLEYVSNRLKVGGDLMLNDCKKLKELPSDLKVGRNIELGNTSIKSLPNNLTVNGNLNLKGCESLKSLPSGLKVTGILNLTGSNIKELPSDLKVDGDIYGAPKKQTIGKKEVETTSTSKKNNAYQNSVEKEIADATKILDVLKSKNSIDFSTKEQEHLLKQTIKMFEDIVSDRSLILKEM